MSERDEELELKALQRELDDAFATTRPRRGFEDELWLRVQSSRPATNRLGNALAGFFASVRAVPVAPAAAIAGFLVVAIGVGLFSATHSFSPRGGASGGAALSQTSEQRNGSAPVSQDMNGTGGFGRLPTPAFDNGTKTSAPPASSGAAQYLGPVRYVWAGTANLGVTVAPVYRYGEPSTGAADQFASSLGAVLRERTPGLLGSYSASTYTLNIRPTVAQPASEPTYFVIASPAMPPVDAAGTPEQVATVFLAQHGLVPSWSYTVAVDGGGDLVKVRFNRQFGIGGYGEASLVDGGGARYGLEVDMKGNRPVLVTGVLPLSLDAGTYRLAPPDAAIRAFPALESPASAPAVQLTDVQLVYVLVPAGAHSFYEPAYLFSGKFQVGGGTYTRSLLVAAVDPSQRNP